jgi:hypothetical protein
VGVELAAVRLDEPGERIVVAAPRRREHLRVG